MMGGDLGEKNYGGKNIEANMSQNSCNVEPGRGVSCHICLHIFLAIFCEKTEIWRANMAPVSFEIMGLRGLICAQKTHT